MPVTREITGIRGKMAAMGDIMTGMLHQAVEALRLQDRELAVAVIARDSLVDSLETEIEDMCLGFLARYAPKAFELRYVVAATRLISDMERIADNSVAICRESLSRHLVPIIISLAAFPKMTALATSMVDRAVSGVLAVDDTVQPQITQDDFLIGDYQREIHQSLVERLMSEPDEASEIVSLIGIARRIERVADHAKNMAVMIPYITEGKLMRHPKEKPDGGE